MISSLNSINYKHKIKIKDTSEQSSLVSFFDQKSLLKKSKMQQYKFIMKTKGFEHEISLVFLSYPVRTVRKMNVKKQ